MSETTAASSSPPAAPIPSHLELFLAFFRITVTGFGGTLPWTRRMFVEEKRWLSEQEFNDLYALCQFLPGPNIVNLASVFGSRMQGPTGAVAAWTGFLVLPFFLMLAAAMLYSRFGDVDAVRRVLGGIAPAAAGLIVATVAKMAMPLFRGAGPGLLMLIATAFAIGVMRWPLLVVMLVVAPTSIALAWWVRR
ncbi:MAG TPA: chromate transporter [Xanthobacteraceae bacterium]|nr:chromate transporter [Xanthobacteraceae bacterium]